MSIVFAGAGTAAALAALFCALARRYCMSPPRVGPPDPAACFGVVAGAGEKPRASSESSAELTGGLTAAEVLQLQRQVRALQHELEAAKAALAESRGSLALIAAPPVGAMSAACEAAALAPGSAKRGERAGKTLAPRAAPNGAMESVCARAPAAAVGAVLQAALPMPSDDGDEARVGATTEIMPAMAVEDISTVPSEPPP